MDRNRRVARLSSLPRERLSRRSLLRGSALAATGLTAAGLVGCGDDDDDDDDDVDVNGDTNGSADDATQEPTAAATAPGEPDEEADAEGEEGGEGEDIAFAFALPAPHAGILTLSYVADGAGYLAEEGITQEILYQTQTGALIAGGQAQIAFPPAEQLFNANAAGQALRAVYQPFYGFLFGIRVPADSDITAFTADSFRDTRIGITEPGGGEVPVLRALMAREGLDPAEVELFPTGGIAFTLIVDQLRTGEMAAFAGSHLDFEIVEQSGVELRDITPQEINDLTADNAFAALDDYLEENRDVMVRYCRAHAKAKVFTLENPEAAIDIALGFAPDSGTAEEMIPFVEALAINRAEPPAGTPEGGMSVEHFEAYQALLLEGGTGSPDDPLGYTEPLDIEEMLVQDLITEIHDFDAEAVRQQAQDYQPS
ncbi:MAG: hypothetical protein GEU28_04690 [Dehalococcoidia bacterium]|nr:hypothetical protein [Dehalococcoidia bacterium]